MSSELINQFVEKKSVDALNEFITSDDSKKIGEASILVADVLGTGDAFVPVADSAKDGESKLLSSFHKNLLLLIQKTWVEEFDEELKEEVLYHLEEFNKKMEDKAYDEAYSLFLGIVSDVVYLMFGAQTKNPEFDEYALRIDPEFGLFWWYIKSLPKDAVWNKDKCRLAILLGMYFLANY
ncbi:MAG: hypothetical protein IKQ13_12245 [Treponema sp.]|jgi:hypothetical protein|nr:hypothetical protein [Treponema sp.]MBQ1713989.1 hypothetical protein [Treponema sp.]MBQ1795324.1 hypothetical protein [Treponema sp.]MBQ2356917.1 hypothetical protein [Treponema sp.]MBQ2547702.1 hypothetical protein [Treponema sp.]